ncbi:MAG: hypothetical protein ACTSRA_19055, partial [Promethearchaeota archaeon]
RADGNMTGAFQLAPFAFGVCHGDHSEKMQFLNARASRSGGWGWAANAKDPDNLLSFTWDDTDQWAQRVNES